MNFKVGDVVYLKSNSPLMTIKYIYGNGSSINGSSIAGHLQCIWFADNEFKVETFNPETVKLDK